MRNKRTPDIRFSGFSEEWEERMLGDLVIDVSRPLKMVDDGIYQLVTVKRRNGGIVSRGIFKGSEVLVKSQFIIKSGDYLISKRQVVHGANGIVPGHLDGSIVSNEYLVLHGTKNLSIDFFSLISELPIMYKNFFLSSYGIDIEKLVFNVSDWKRRKIFIPSNSEQHKITSFLEVINNAITFSQKELTTLKQAKQGFSQKMFPIEGESVPEIRFPGFTGDWEQRKFEKVLHKQDGIRRGPFGSALKKDFFVKDSEYAVYEQQNAIYNNYETRYNITKEKFEELKSFQLSEGDFILSGAGTIGRISRVPKGIKQGVFNQALIRFKIDEDITDSEYFVQWIRSENMQRKLTGVNPGSAITNLVPMSEVKNWDVLVPSKNEQTQIGNFLKKLDDTIALHQRELEALKETKKAFLQKMFV